MIKQNIPLIGNGYKMSKIIKTIHNVQITYNNLSKDKTKDIERFILEGYSLEEVDSLCQVQSKVIDCFKVEYYPIGG